MDKKRLSLIPEKPGSYQYLDKYKNVIYVGKAKNLRKRVASYFNKIQTGKTRALVDEIDDINFVITDSELEALILEINLIKKYNPKYNVLLKDDKTYPYIALSKDNAPYLKVLRNTKKNKLKDVKLFGPFPNVSAAREVVDLLNRIYPLRKCNPLKKDLCLYYHMNQCLGYCKKDINLELVKSYIKDVTSFLNGNTTNIEKIIKRDMERASKFMNYEKALELKRTLDYIKIVSEKQKIDLNSSYNFDMFNYYVEDLKISICVFFVRSGVLLGKINKIFDYKDNVFIDYIINFYENNKLLASEILLPDNSYKLLEEYFNVPIRTPLKGKLKSLMDLNKENAKEHLNVHIKEIMIKDEKKKAAISTLNNLTKREIYRIFAFDNSHLFGDYYVGAMVAFDYFEKNKNLYRKFKIQSGALDDLSAMREVIYRYFFKVLTSGEKSCDLVLVDGGKQQVKLAQSVLDELNLDILVYGIKKDLNHKARILVNDKLEEIVIDPNLFLFLSRIDEEAHRFAITYHKSLRDKGLYKSILDLVDGLGPKRKAKLLKIYKNIEQLKTASLEDLLKIVPLNVAKQIIRLSKQ